MDRRIRLALVGVIAVVTLVVYLMADPPTASISIDEVAEAPERHDDGELAVRGTITNGSIDTLNSSFVLGGEEHTLPVDIAGVSLSDGFSEGKTVLVHGELVKKDGEWWLQAERIDIGCPSKYEAEDPSEHPDGVPMA